MGKKQTKKLLGKLAKRKRIEKGNRGGKDVNSSFPKSNTSSGPRSDSKITKPSKHLPVSALNKSTKRPRSNKQNGATTMKKIKKSDVSIEDPENEEENAQLDEKFLENVSKVQSEHRDKEKKIKSISKKMTQMNVEDFLKGGFADFDDFSDSNDGIDDDDNDDDNADDDNKISKDYLTSNDSNDKEKEKKDNDDDDDDDQDDQDEAKRHRKELLELKEKDPEFFRHLESEGADLLQFGDDDEEEESDDDDDDDDDDISDIESNEMKVHGPGKTDKDDHKKGKNDLILIDSKKLAKLIEEAFRNKSFTGIRALVQAFRSACHLTDVDTSDQNDKVQGFKYKIDDPAIYQELMVQTLSNLNSVFNEKLWPNSQKDTENDAILRNRKPNTSNSWKKYETLIKAFLKALLHLLQNGSKDESMMKYVIKCCGKYSSFIDCFPKSYGPRYIKAYIEIWSNTPNDMIRILSYARIREIATASIEEYLELALRSTYMSFVRGAKFSSADKAPRLALQAQCFVDLAGVDFTTTYQIAYVYIRRLALYLRDTITSKTTEAMRNVYSWQYLHCLRIWAAVLCAYPGTNPSLLVRSNNDPVPRAAKKTTSSSEIKIHEANEQLRPLIYPLVQIIFGVIRLVPTARNYPMRLHCVDILVKLSKASDVYIPCTLPLIEILQNNDLWNEKPTPYSGKPPVLEFSIRLSKEQAKSAVFQDILVLQTLKLLKEIFIDNRLTPGFPELSFPVSLVLKNFAKITKVARWRKKVRSLATEIALQADRIRAVRDNSSFGPSQVHKLRSLLSEELGTTEQFPSFSEESDHSMPNGTQDISRRMNAAKGILVAGVEDKNYLDQFDPKQKSSATYSSYSSYSAIEEKMTTGQRNQNKEQHVSSVPQDDIEEGDSFNGDDSEDSGEEDIVEDIDLNAI